MVWVWCCRSTECGLVPGYRHTSHFRFAGGAQSLDRASRCQASDHHLLPREAERKTWRFQVCGVAALGGLGIVCLIAAVCCVADWGFAVRHVYSMTCLKPVRPVPSLICPLSKRAGTSIFSISGLAPPFIVFRFCSNRSTSYGVDYRSDLYSLGITFFEMLSGSLPFTTQDQLQLVHCHLAVALPVLHRLPSASHVPPILSAIIAKLCAKQPANRYQSAWGLLHDLQLCKRSLVRVGPSANSSTSSGGSSDTLAMDGAAVSGLPVGSPALATNSLAASASASSSTSASTASFYAPSLTLPSTPTTALNPPTPTSASTTASIPVSAASPSFGSASASASSSSAAVASAEAFHIPEFPLGSKDPPIIFHLSSKVCCDRVLLVGVMRSGVVGCVCTVVRSR
jgi:serine/threonine protein kinase